MIGSKGLRSISSSAGTRNTGLCKFDDILTMVFAVDYKIYCFNALWFHRLTRINKDTISCCFHVDLAQ